MKTANCHCGAPLTIVPLPTVLPADRAYHAYCLRCRRLAASGFDGDGHVIVCDGYGETETEAAIDYHERVDTF